MSTPARYFDGESATPIHATVVANNDELILFGADGYEIARVPFSRLARSIGHRVSTEIVLVPLDRINARINILASNCDVAFEHRLMAIRRRASTRNVRRRIGLASTVLVVVGLFLSLGLPWLAGLATHLVPLEAERQIGGIVIEQLRLDYRECSNGSGQRALAALTGKLAASSTYDVSRFEVHVTRSAVDNAFAFPGGLIFITAGLIDLAENPDELAGVLAHEMAHVQKRHALRRWFRQRVQSAIVDAASGGVSGMSVINEMTEQFLTASYSRGVEAEADAIALDMLEASGISTQGFASFFDRLVKHEEWQLEITGRVSRYLSTHPATPERAELARSRADTVASPALSSAEWLALKDICR